MSPQISHLKKRAFISPPKIKTEESKDPSLQEAAHQDVSDDFSAARYKQERKLSWAQIGLQLGLAGNALTGTVSQAQAQTPMVVQEQMLETPLAASQVDLAVDETSVQTALQQFVKEEFTLDDAHRSLELFSEQGQISYGKLARNREFSPVVATDRLNRGMPVKIELMDGSVQEISSLEDLQALDTFNGLGLKPVAPEEVVRALRGLELGVDGDDGLIRNEFTLTKEDSFSAYQAYKVLTQPTPDSSGATVKGALIGGAIIGAGIGIAAFGGASVIPGLASAVTSASPLLIGAAGAAVAGGMATGAFMGARGFHKDNPTELEVRYGMDQGLKVKNLEHAVETFQWLQERAANPFTESQQETALRYFQDSTGYFDEDGKSLTMAEARQRLHDGEEVKVPNSMAGQFDSISNLRQLQQLDTVRGSGVNPILPPHVSSSLRELESGTGPADGLYKAGNFETEGRLSAYEAVDYLFRERQPINVVVKGKQYDTKTLENIQELNALMGDGVNTILPNQQFEALRRFGSSGLIKGESPVEVPGARGRTTTQSEQVTLDAYEALQAIRGGQELKVESRQRLATVRNLGDFHELKSLEFDRRNTIVSDRDFELLRHWDHQGQYSVDKDGHQDHAYEALQALQSGQQFGIVHRDRVASLESIDDMVELAALETPEAGFEHAISQRDYDLLQHWEATGSYQVKANHQDYSYEALQALQKGQSFDITHRDRPATVTRIEDMVELAALETPEAGFEHQIPQLEYDLLQHWEGAGTYVVDGNHSEFAYEGLQALQQGRQFDIQSMGRNAPVHSYQDMIELSAFETPEAGFDHTIPRDEFERLTHFEQAQGNRTTRIGNREGRAYEGYRALRNGVDFDVLASGVWNTVTDAQALHDLDALLGRGVNDILPQDQYDLLKHLGDDQQGEGLYKNGARLNSYSALQEFRAGRDISYDFTGGDFGELLHINTPNIESLDRTRDVRDNQKEYDRYAYSAEDWQDKMEDQASSLPSAAQDNLSYGQQELRDGESELRRGQSDLSDAERDLSRAESDLSSAESDLRSAESDLSWARSLPTYIDEDVQVEYCNDAGDCYWEWETESVYNYRRDREISSAQSDVRRAKSDISSAESDISRAESDISDAERDIRAARSHIAQAEGLIFDAEAIIANLSDYQALLGRTSDSNLGQTVAAAKERLAWMKSRTHVSSLNATIGRQQRLINNQETRPERPKGWVAPAREDLAQF